MSQQKTGQTTFMIIGDRAHTVSAGQKLKSPFMEIFFLNFLQNNKIIPACLVIAIPNVQRGFLV